MRSLGWKRRGCWGRGLWAAGELLGCGLGDSLGVTRPNPNPRRAVVAGNRATAQDHSETHLRMLFLYSSNIHLCTEILFAPHVQMHCRRRGASGCLRISVFRVYPPRR
jgi:hypothetical protein